MSGFAPVAIVGRACLLPGAHSPAQLWQALVEGRDLLSSVPDGYWRLDPRRVLGVSASAPPENSVTDRGGYVRGFDSVFDPNGFAIGASRMQSFDPLVQWLAHTARAALKDAGLAVAPRRTDVIVGNLAYPTHALSAFAERTWLSGQADPFLRDRGADIAGIPSVASEERFSTGRPARLVAEAVRADGQAFCLDAACASSLYALRIACDQLHDGDADLVLCGAANRADDLFLHGGFTALKALSRTGRSRPFHRDADGLLPAEGAAFVVLKRLEDAEQAGDHILGVVRAVGLSNDGRSGGLLVPAAAGQVRAMEAAYAQAGLDPADVSLVECHATGTAVGDREEIVSMARVFGAGRSLPIGSHKSNMGHLITAAGMAGLLKALGAIEHRTRPPTVHADDPIPELTETTDFRLLTKAEAWESTGPRRAAINAFGFGGNNAHVIVEEWRAPKVKTARVRPAAPSDPIAVVGIGVIAGDAGDAGAFARVLLDGAAHRKEAAGISLPLAEVRFPPADLRHTLPQQTAFLRVVMEAVRDAGGVDGKRAGVIANMQCDAEIARYGLRWRLAEWAERWAEAGHLADAAWLVRARDATVAPLDVAAVLGTMPNMPANRINSQFDLRGLGFTTSDEEASGLVPLQLSCRALRANELDVAIAGAVDLACEPVTRAALGGKEAGDVAVALVLKREADARRDGNRIYALLGPDVAGASELGVSEVAARFGTAPAATGLLSIAAAAIAIASRRMQRTGDAWIASKGARRVSVRNIAVSEPAGEAPVRSATVALQVSEVPVTPVWGEVAFVFTGAAAAYRGMGRDLFRAVPELADRMGERCNIDPRVASWMFEDGASPSPFDQLKGSTVLCQAHADLARNVLGLRPTAVLGMSSGETNALFAFGAWDDMGVMFDEIARSGMYDRFLGGRFESAATAWGTDGAVAWRNWRVRAPIADVEAALRGFDRVHITIINAPADCVIAGDAGQCEQVVSRIGAPRCALLQHDLIAHAPELVPFADEWRRIHSRRTKPVPGVRFYTNATNRAYAPERDACAEALLGQAVRGVDFRPTVEAAWNDGVRIFVELGPRNAMSRAISSILRGRDNLCVSFDRAGRPALDQIADATSRLRAAGVAVDMDALGALLRGTRTFGDAAASWSGERMTVLPAHPSSIVLSPLPPKARGHVRAVPEFENLQAMPPAPRLLAPLGRSVQPATGSTRVAAVANDPAAAILASTAAVHRAFLDHQTQLHAASLAMQRRAFELIIGGAGGTASPSAVPPSARAPKFSRSDLEELAVGPISRHFGPSFAAQDGFRRQVRMPAPPLLLADRVVQIEGEPGSMGLGSLTTETDVRPDAWYLHQGRVPPGIVIESGQADLLLISWLGVDSLNRGERVYRLLGCELVFHGSLPAPGETLRFDIHVDGHASHGDVRLFFFHYDCHIGDRLLLSVREGQAGFFSDAELASSAGVLWSAEDDAPKENARLDPTPQASTRRAFDAQQVSAFVAGDAYACFGPGFEYAAPHQRTPATPSGRLRLIDSVSAFDPAGGPWKRGYLRAETTVPPDAWFYNGHFKDDPCMPGTLMADAAVQALSFHMAALGLTIARDGWRFEPVPDERFKFVCRGQVIPDRTHQLTYEVFVEEVIAGPQPVVHAALLCTADGLKVFHCRRFGVRLVPDWPLNTRRHLLTPPPAPHRVHPQSDIRGDYAALLACAWGSPSEAFGDMYRPFDGGRVPRLPGPPYHFITRVVDIDCPPGARKIGAVMRCEYDVPPDAWYFGQNGSERMPYTGLMEIMLQPCGWMASYMGTAIGDGEYLFRNLDGDHAMPMMEVGRDAGTIAVKIVATNAVNAPAMRLVFFRVEATINGAPLLAFNTSFGFFSPESFRKQSGLPISSAQAEAHAAPGDYFVDLTTHPDRFFVRGPRIGTDQLLLLDALTGYWPDAGAAGLGRMRGRKKVDPGAWYFKAHFFQDPVQPGSLGVDALVQLLECFCIERGLADGMAAPRFQSPAIGVEQRWKYRGQVQPTSKEVQADIEVTRVEREAGGVLVVAEASLWVDGLRIYEVGSLAIRIVEDGEVARQPDPISAAVQVWRRRLKTETWPGEQMMFALVDRFLGRLVLPDAASVERIANSRALFVANHQVALESLLFCVLMAGVNRRPIRAIAKAEHRDTWLGRLIELCQTYPGVTSPKMLAFFDRDNQGAMLDLLTQLRADMERDDLSVLVHAPGTRAERAGVPVDRLSGALLDFAAQASIPIVPVRFVGALPTESVGRRLEFPVGYARQDIYVGAPIEPAALAALPLRERKDFVLHALNALGPSLADEQPNVADAEFGDWVVETMSRGGLAEPRAAVLQSIHRSERTGEALRRAIDAALDGRAIVGDDAVSSWMRRLASWFRSP